MMKKNLFVLLLALILPFSFVCAENDPYRSDVPAASHPDSLLNRYPALTGRDVFDAADDGDAAAKAVLDRYYDYVAAGITNLVNILSPEMVLIGGGISRQGERLLAPIRRYVAANCFGGTERPQPVIQAAQLGNEAGIIGAAAL